MAARIYLFLLKCVMSINNIVPISTANIPDNSNDNIRSVASIFVHPDIYEFSNKYLTDLFVLDKYN